MQVSSLAVRRALSATPQQRSSLAWHDGQLLLSGIDKEHALFVPRVHKQVAVREGVEVKKLERARLERRLGEHGAGGRCKSELGF